MGLGDQKLLFLTSAGDENLRCRARNLPKVTVQSVESDQLGRCSAQRSRALHTRRVGRTVPRAWNGDKHEGGRMSKADYTKFSSVRSSRKRACA